MKEWTFTEARRNLEKLFDTALTGEVQVITRYKQRVLVAISFDLYQKLILAKEPPQSDSDAETRITAKDTVDAARKNRERDITHPSHETQEE